MIDFEKIGKWYFIVMGLIFLVGITGWFSGGKNGNLIFSSAIIIDGIIFGIGFILVKLPELRYGKERAYQMKQEEMDRELQKIKKQSDIWNSFTKEKRENLCEQLGLPSKYSKYDLIGIPANPRKSMIYRLDEEERKKSEEEYRKYAETKTSQEKKKGDLDKYYYNLQCEPTDSFETVQDSYRELCKRLHPDKSTDGKELLNKKFKVLKESFDKIQEAHRSKKT